MGYDWNFDFLWPYWFAFLRGAWVTIEISAVSFVLGTSAGVFIGILLRSMPLRRVFLLLNDAIRAVPMLVLILFVYYFPYEQILGIHPLGPLASTIIAISISQAAYTADIVRAAIDGVSIRAIWGGRALGLREIIIWRYIILPDIFRQLLPTQIAFLIGIVRLSSLASIIGCEEIVFVARVASAQSFRTLEAWTLVACIYIVMVVPLTVLGRYIENLQWLKRRA